MSSGRGKAVRIALTLFTVIVSIAAIAYVGFFRYTDLFATLAKEGEAIRKGKEYGMYFTLADVQRALNVPPEQNSGDAVESACETFFEAEDQFRKERRQSAQIFDSSNYVSAKGFHFTLPPVAQRETEYFRPVVDAFLKETDSELDRLYCVIKRDWSKPYEVSNSQFRSLSHVQQFLLNDFMVAAQHGDQTTMTQKLKLVTRVRNCSALIHEWMWGYRAGVISRSYSAMYILEALKLVKQPSPDLVSAIRENQVIPDTADFKHLCRMVFYVGSDGFPPSNKLVSLMPRYSSSDLKWLIRVPRVTRAWQVRIQLAAIAGYEEGLKHEGSPDAINYTRIAIAKNGDSGGLSSTYYESSIGMGMGDIMQHAKVLDDAIPDLEKRLKTLAR